ncbi:hypothetical protein BDQ12DRAFT_726007 [Crucibulum laeve]|uniref:Uncharacterized protein n=1 Tax=Crucibulum laeve TaxID=68775 RepID=A0A5C3LTR6_9AGAR|nr:hypothetical protein BDQ12DRAFT_726007 [Crucibulum laeve]
MLSTAFTTFRTIKTLNISGSWRTQQNTLSYLLLQEGTIYLIFVSGLNTASLILVFATPPTSFLKKLFNALTIPLSGLVTARFLLHLREWEHKKTATSRTSSELPRSAIHFAGTVNELSLTSGADIE